MKNSNFIHHLSRRSFKSVLTIGVALLLTGAFASASSKPNIIFIMADDMGYGDVGCYNEDSKIPTPNMDRLAREGIRFTDAHSADSVCTPSRYGLMTGRYCWRTSLINSVLFNYEPPLIEKGRMTLASLLKKNGYRTAISGKWHLGLGFSAKRVMPTEGNGFLFDMNKDPFETQNLWDDHPEIVEKLSREFEAIYRGR